MEIIKASEPFFIYSPVNVVCSPLTHSYTKLPFSADKSCSECDCSNSCACNPFTIPPYLLSNGKLLLNPEYLSDSIYECNDTCCCSVDCRLKRSSENPKLKLIETSKGFGVSCSDSISKGEFVCEYAGEIISLDQAKQRWIDRKKLGKNYIMSLKEFNSDGEIVSETNIDPVGVGNIGKFINHSCNPNMDIKFVRSNSQIPSCAFFANQDIQAEQELTYDYGLTDEDTKNRIECKCGQENCRKYLPFTSF